MRPRVPLQHGRRRQRRRCAPAAEGREAAAHERERQLPPALSALWFDTTPHSVRCRLVERVSRARCTPNCIATHPADRILFKLMADAMPHYVYFLHQLTMFVYVICFTVPVILAGEFFHITRSLIRCVGALAPFFGLQVRAHLRASFRSKFMVMGLLDNFCTLIVILCAPHVYGPIQILLMQVGCNSGAGVSTLRSFLPLGDAAGDGDCVEDMVQATVSACALPRRGNNHSASPAAHASLLPCALC